MKNFILTNTRHVVIVMAVAKGTNPFSFVYESILFSVLLTTFLHGQARFLLSSVIYLVSFIMSNRAYICRNRNFRQKHTHKNSKKKQIKKNIKNTKKRSMWDPHNK